MGGTHFDSPVIKCNVGIRCLEVDVWGNLAVFEHHNALDHTCNPGSTLEMSDVGFDGSNIDWIPLRACRAECLGNCFEFSPIAGLCSGSMAFDVACLAKVQLCRLVDCSNIGDLCLFTGQCNTCNG